MEIIQPLRDDIIHRRALKEPPMFQVTDTHYAKTWLLDPRAPKMEKPEAIQNIHEKLLKAFNI